MAGYSGTPLARKLGVRSGSRVGWDGAPAGFRASLDLPPSVVVDLDFDEERRWDVIVAFVAESGALALALECFPPLIRWDGGLWLAWPKRSSALAGELRDSHVRRAGLDAGLVDNKVCAVDEDWSALRFVYRRADRPKQPRRSPGAGRRDGRGG